jgi:hypothetical protein
MASDDKVIAKDSMHSGPQAAPPDVDLTSNPAARELNAPLPKGSSGSVGSERPEQSSVSAGEFKPDRSLGTLVTNIPSNEERQEAEAQDSAAVNPGNPAPEGPVAAQPGESLEDAGKRIKAESKKSKAASK